MKKAGIRNLFGFLRQYRHTEHASGDLEDLLQFNLITPMNQRKLVELGKVMSRIVSMDMVLALGEKGFRQDLVDNAVVEIRHEIAGLLGSFNNTDTPQIVGDYKDRSSWFTL